MVILFNPVVNRPCAFRGLVLGRSCAHFLFWNPSDAGDVV
jgi:hypothetical protein